MTTGGRDVRPRVLAIALLLAGCSSAVSAPPGTAPASAVPSPVATGTPTPTIDLPSLSGRLLFARAGGPYGDEVFFTANADGTGNRRVGGYLADKNTCCARWSPDGRFIATSDLAPDGRITAVIVNPDGSNRRNLPLPPGTLNFGCGVWSPDMRRMACIGFDDAHPGSNGIYVVRAADGLDRVQVTDQRDEIIGFTADGVRIVFFRRVSGFPSIGDLLGGSLFSVDIAGGTPTRVTPADVHVEDLGGGDDGRISHDGRWIVFTSDGAIWKIAPDGSGLQLVFRDSGGGLAITPVWSPDGRLILFGLDPPGSLATVDAAPPNGLFVVRADGTGLTPLITTLDWKREPDWASAP